MSRWKAAAIHLLFSVAIALIIATVFLTVWYPPPFFSAAGADVLMLILVGVDVTLGPLVTLIIFRSGKPGLKFDLAFIAVAQVCSLAYGVSVVLQSRPVFLVAAVDRLILVFANDLDAERLAGGKRPEFQTLSWSGPKLVGAVLPQSSQEQSDLVWSSAMAKQDIERLPAYYVPYEDQAHAFAARAHGLDVLHKKHPEANALLAKAVANSHLSEAELGYVPLVARKHDLSMLISRQTGLPVSALAIDPW